MGGEEAWRALLGVSLNVASSSRSSGAASAANASAAAALAVAAREREAAATAASTSRTRQYSYSAAAIRAASRAGVPLPGLEEDKEPYGLMDEYVDNLLGTPAEERPSDWRRPSIEKTQAALRGQAPQIIYSDGRRAPPVDPMLPRESLTGARRPVWQLQLQLRCSEHKKLLLRGGHPWRRGHRRTLTTSITS